MLYRAMKVLKESKTSKDTKTSKDEKVSEICMKIFTVLLCCMQPIQGRRFTLRKILHYNQPILVMLYLFLKLAKLLLVKATN